MRKLLLLVPTLSALLGCDPVLDLDVVVSVPPEAQAALGESYPAAVVLSYQEGGSEAAPSSTILGVLCAPSDAAVSFEDHRGYVGCATETTISAWLVPLPPGSLADCPGWENGQAVNADPAGAPPWATSIAFDGLDEDCSSSHAEEVTLTLQAPDAM